MTTQNIDIASLGSSPCISDAEFKNFISGSEHRRHGLLKRAVARGDYIRLRRGLYCLADRYRRHPLNLLAIAQRIYGPSYVSFESALSYHGWIPEAVPQVTSASLNRSRTFKTPIGVFIFTRIPARIFFAHVERVASGPDVFFVARPWRAVVDYVFAYQKTWKGIHPLIESLRIDEEDLGSASRDELEALADAFGKRRIVKFIQSVIGDLKL